MRGGGRRADCRRGATMIRLGRAFGVIVLTGLLGGCSQLSPNIPSARPAPAPPVLEGTKEPTVAQISATAKAAIADLGVQIFWHGVNDSYSVKTNGDRLLDYVMSLGANSVGISFPIFTDGAWPTRVYTIANITPTPESLAEVIRNAKGRGLRVMLRPIIDEKNITGYAAAWRGSIEPKNDTAWFASYREALLPFLAAGQAAGADTFVVGTELDSLVDRSAQWQELLTAAAGVFKGRLSYADNWGEWATGRPGVAGAVPGLDAYPQLRLSDSATVAQITNAWTSWLQKRPAELTSTVVQEIGIAATPGAYAHPARWAEDGQTVVPSIQVNWFAGACAAVKSLSMAGIYFWSLDAWAEPAKAASYNAGSFIGRGDAAIQACFASGWPGQ
jgi:hypothetical protein